MSGGLQVVPINHQVTANMDSIDKARLDQNHLTTQLSTGKQHSSYDQVEKIDVVQSLERQSSDISQVSQNIKNSRLVLHSQKQTLVRIQEIAQVFWEELTLLNNKGVTNDPSVALKAQNRLNEVEKLLNQLDPTGQNPFAGSALGRAVDMSLLDSPVHPNSVLDFKYFIGSSTAREIQISSDGNTIKIESPASTQGLAKVILALKKCSEIVPGETDELAKIREAQGLVRSGIGTGDVPSADALVSVIQGIETTLNEIGNAEKRNQALEIDVKTMLTERTDTDTANAILERAQKEAQTQIGYASLLSMLKSQKEVMSHLMSI